MLALLEDSPLNGQQREHVRLARDAAASLLEMLNDILDFSKIEAGKLTIDRVRFEPAEIIERCLASLSLMASHKGLGFFRHVDGRLREPCWGDPVRLRQIITNLVGNAIKFTERGEVRVRAMLLDAVHGPATLSFEVSDTGIGVDPELKQTLFEPFTQADVSITRRYGGTGLGLAICKQLVERMGGEIGIESEPGAGSTFWFRVPLESAPGPLPPPPQPLAPSPASAPSVGAGS